MGFRVEVGFAVSDGSVKRGRRERCAGSALDEAQSVPHQSRTSAAVESRPQRFCSAYTLLSFCERKE